MELWYLILNILVHSTCDIIHVPLVIYKNYIEFINSKFIAPCVVLSYANKLSVFIDTI